MLIIVHAIFHAIEKLQGYKSKIYSFFESGKKICGCHITMYDQIWTKLLDNCGTHQIGFIASLLMQH